MYGLGAYKVTITLNLGLQKIFIHRTLIMDVGESHVSKDEYLMNPPCKGYSLYWFVSNLVNISFPMSGDLVVY